MLSRIFNTAKSLLSTTPEAEQKKPAQAPSKDTEKMVATRRRGELPPIRATPTKKEASPANSKIAQKRKTYELPVAEVAAESQNEASQGQPGSAKRRKVVTAKEDLVEAPVEVAAEEEDEAPNSAKSKEAGEGKTVPKKDLEIRTKTTISVVLPAMAPIPASELSNSEEGLEEDVDSAVPEIEVAADESAKERAGEQDFEVLAQETSAPSSPKNLLNQEEIIEHKPKSSNQERRYAAHTDFSSDRITPFQNKQLALPGFLPAEFLEEDNEKEKPRRALDLVRPLSAVKRRKNRDLVEAPKDRRIGDTTYRVAKTQKSSLAPKSKTIARSTKEAWLHNRNRLRLKQGNMRKPFSRGFFVEKK